ncbi:probable serine/threonine-protein kinase ndrC isoform X3 [Lutzomyia longipalpis]|uniref:probable serine/threonine-protein kinase ndrC isoform X3 n=1 Tax=Lutzomyia longipalpis TaxID=7200 RepID=UPI00248441BF|nr:probable serine/threonine-protein kinase ndrC isoform X3 [Lutzomyia longipalpis]
MHRKDSGASMKSVSLSAPLILLLIVFSEGAATGASSPINPATNCTGDGQAVRANCTSDHAAPRRVSSVDRDNKLMTVLAARRSALARDRGRHVISRQVADLPPRDLAQRDLPVRECERNCTRSFTVQPSPECMRRCASLRGATVHRRIADRTVSSREEENISESNTIVNGRDELLQTEESAHGMTIIHTSRELESFRNATKKSTNNSLDTNSKQRNITSKDVVSPTKPTRSYVDIRSKRLEVAKQRQKTSTDKSVEEADLLPYLYFGQKITATKITETKNQVITTKRSPYFSNSGSAKQSLGKTKDAADEDEIMEVSAPKVSTTEKNKFWQHGRLYYPTRNIVAFSRRGLNMSGFGNAKASTSTSTDASVPRLLEDVPVDIIHIPENNSSAKLVTLRSTDAAPTPFALDKNPPNLHGIILEVPPSSLPALDIHSINPSSSNFDKDVNLVIFTNTKRTPDSDPSPSEVAPVINGSDILTINRDLAPEFTTEASDTRSEATLDVRPDARPEIRPEVRPDRSEGSKLGSEDAITVVRVPEIPSTTSTTSTTTTTSSTTTTSTTTTTPVSTTTTPSQPSLTVPESAEEDTNTRAYSIVPGIKAIFPNISTAASLPPDNDEAMQFPIASSTSKSVSKTTFSTSVRSTSVPTPVTSSPAVEDDTEQPEITTETVEENGVDTDAPKIINISNSMLPSFFNISSIFPTFPIMANNISTTRKTSLNAEGGVLLRRNGDVTIEMHRMNMAAYVLAGLGMFPIAIIIIYVVRTVILKREAKQASDLERYMSDGQPISPVVKMEDSSGEESIMTERDFNRNNLRFKSLLGEGNFGQVWKAEADDLAGHLGTTRIVAVKTERSENGSGGLKMEADIMRKLGSHPNVVTLLGACIDQEPHLLIMEFAMRGRLLSLLRAARSAIHSVPQAASSGNKTASIPLSPRRLSGFAHDIARGMEYIASKRIVHRDLAARNVLLDHNGVCKICDFGMSIDLDKSKRIQTLYSRKTNLRRSHSSNRCGESRFRFQPFSTLDTKFGICRSESQTCGTKMRPALPIRWMAPEALQYHIFSTETDVWAFGIVVWEIATLGCTPYPNLSGREVVRSVPAGIRPEIPPDCRPELYHLMTKTWRKDPRQRPSFSEARNDLAHALRQWEIEQENSSEYLDVSGFSEDLEHGMVYFNRRISEFECDI